MPDRGRIPLVALRIWSETETLAPGPGRGEITIDKGIAELSAGTPADLRLTACGDMSDFRDSRLSLLAFKDSSLQTPAGRIADGPPVVIQILNDDPLPSSIPVDLLGNLHRRGRCPRRLPLHRAGPIWPMR